MNVKTILAFLLVGCLAAFPLRADPIVDLLTNLMDYPALDRTEFEQELRQVYTTLENLERYGAKDVPDGVTDPLYWALHGRGYSLIDESELSPHFTCNRIGRGGFSAAVKASDPWLAVENSMTMTGLLGMWRWPMEAFPEDAVARLDCHLTINPRDNLDVALEAIAQAVGPLFEDIEIKNEQENSTRFEQPTQTLDAYNGITKKHARANRIFIKKNKYTTISFTVWLLHTGS